MIYLVLTIKIMLNKYWNLEKKDKKIHFKKENTKTVIHSFEESHKKSQKILYVKHYWKILVIGLRGKNQTSLEN